MEWDCFWVILQFYYLHVKMWASNAKVFKWKLKKTTFVSFEKKKIWHIYNCLCCHWIADIADFNCANMWRNLHCSCYRYFALTACYRYFALTVMFLIDVN